MNVFHITRSCSVTALVALVTTFGLSQHSAAQPASAAGQAGVEVLTRGPVHEAFAETITFDPGPGTVAPKAPPADIEELPPRQRPAGRNLAWIPGYWSWDYERNDFLWLSGIWRALPPGRQWVPGYWGQTQRGAQWTSGYWADAAASEIDYLPEPPATVEVGPNIAAPTADDIWLPGCWIWQQNRYAWRPGYWTKGNQDWDWVPDHYVWTPSGYVFVDGYYDYSVPRRGVLFAPVYFSGGLRTQRGFTYSPSTVINSAAFVSYLFLRPGYNHYYFGDYYGSNYADAGFLPWFSFQSSHRGYDPIYANQRWRHRLDDGWEQRAEANFRNLRDNENARPPRNLAAQMAVVRSGEAATSRNTAVVAPLEELARKDDGQFQFQPVQQEERQLFGQRGQEYRRYLRNRQQLEAGATPATGVVRDTPTAALPARKILARSPIVALPVEQLGKDNTPPQRHQVLKLDREVQPQPRNRGQAQPQRQGGNRGNGQGATAGQAQGPGASRGNNRQGASEGQSRQGQGQGASRGGNRQGASRGPSQDAQRNQSEGGSKEEKKDD